MPDTCFVYHSGGALKAISPVRCDHLFEDLDCVEVPYGDEAAMVLERFAMLGNYMLDNGKLVARQPSEPTPGFTPARPRAATIPGRVLAFDGYLARLDPTTGDHPIMLAIRDAGQTIAVTLTGDIQTERKVFLTAENDPGVLLGTLTIKQQPAEQILTVAVGQPYDLFVINSQYDDYGLSK